VAKTKLNASTMDYLSLKYLHMGLAGLSGGFFLVRGTWMLTGSPLLQQRWVRTLPHIVDTALLSSAVVLAAWSSQYPFVQAWLTAKVLALAVYIVLGTVALKRGRTRRVRGVAYFAALLVFIYIAGVAMSKDPRFFTVVRTGAQLRTIMPAVSDAVTAGEFGNGFDAGFRATAFPLGASRLQSGFARPQKDGR